MELFNAANSRVRKVTPAEWIQWQFNILTGCWDPGTMTNIPYDAFGYYKNGILVIADLMIRPSVFPESLVRFHVQRGQPLQIPVNENGFIIASDGDPRLNGKPLPIENLPVIEVLRSQKSDSKLRIDLEPHWEGDPRKVIFRVRCQGQLKCSFSPERLASALVTTDEFNGPLEFQVVDCNHKHEGDQEDRHGQRELPVSGAEWRTMAVSQLVHIYSQTALFRAPDEVSVYIRAGGDMASQVLCFICLEPPVTIASRCLRCAHAAVISRRTDVDKHTLRGTKAKRAGFILVDGLDTNIS